MQTKFKHEGRKASHGTETALPLRTPTTRRNKSVRTPKLLSSGKRGRKRAAEVETSHSDKVIHLKEHAEKPAVTSSYQAPIERQPYDGDTAYKLYLREVGETPLLTADEAKDLAHRVQKGDKKAHE